MLDTINIAKGYSGGAGQFGVLKGVPTPTSINVPVFQSCRETFQNQYYLNPVSSHMIFVLNNNKRIKDVCDFITCFEDASQIKNGASLGAVNNYDQYLHIKPNWWQSQPLRFSLFTALLRAANNHPDLECAMQFEPYLKTTVTAISKFMEGQNYCFKNNNQWYSSFHNANPQIVDSILTIDIESCFESDIIKKAKAIENICKCPYDGKRLADLCDYLYKN